VGPLLEEARQFFVDFFFDLIQIVSGARRRLNVELAADLAGVLISTLTSLAI
jgi:hypothetical protein